MRIGLVIVGLAAAAVASYFVREHAIEAAVWTELQNSVPAQSLTPTEAQIQFGAVASRSSPSGDQVGHVELPNGDIWRFAFRSHHTLGGPDSYSVFAGPSGTFRVRGDYFCCEVQFPGAPMPKDSGEFLALLRRVHRSVDPIR
jgi:hypothetical protein